MPVFPVSFIVSLLLIIVLIRLGWTNDRKLGTLPKITLFIYALQSLLLGLHWHYGFSLPWTMQAAVATSIPALTWLSLRDMVTHQVRRMKWRHWVGHAIPVFLILVAPLLGRSPLIEEIFMIDIVLVSAFVFYGVAILYMAFRRNISWLDRVPFQRMFATNSAFIIAGCVLISSGLVDLAVAYDMDMTGGTFASDIVGASNLIFLLGLCFTITTVGQTALIADSEVNPLDQKLVIPPEEQQELSQHYQEILVKLDELMVRKHIYRDENLSLDRIARKLMIPARQISTAVNSQCAMNVPQYVNTFRVLEACERLKKSEMPITEITFEVGFMTKSNFNREFLRVVGMSPRAWRYEKACGGEPEMWDFLKNFVHGSNLSKSSFSLYEDPASE